MSGRSLNWILKAAIKCKLTALNLLTNFDIKNLFFNS